MVLHHRLKEGLRFRIRFLGGGVLHEIKYIRRNAGARLVQEVVNILVLQFKRFHMSLFGWKALGILVYRKGQSSE